MDPQRGRNRVVACKPDMLDESEATVSAATMSGDGDLLTDGALDAK